MGTLTGEEFRRLSTLSEIRKHVLALRPELIEAGATEFWHLDEAERLMNEMFADPGAKNFKELSLSFHWHLEFQKAEFEALVRAAKEKK